MQFHGGLLMNLQYGSLKTFEDDMYYDGGYNQNDNTKYEKVINLLQWVFFTKVGHEKRKENQKYVSLTFGSSMKGPIRIGRNW